MRPADHFHVGIVVPDLDAELARLTDLCGYEWSDEVDVATTVRFPTGDESVRFRFRYSKSRPHLELIQEQPGTLWMPVPVSGLHHLGYWSTDLEADGAALERAGYTLQAQGIDDNGGSNWAYYGGAPRPRIELVSRTLEPFLRQLYGDDPGDG